MRYLEWLGCSAVAAHWSLVMFAPVLCPESMAFGPVRAAGLTLVAGAFGARVLMQAGSGTASRVGSKRTPHHFASVFLRRRDGGRDGREVTGWRMDAAGAVDAKTRPPRLGHAADDVPTAPTSRFVIGLAKAWRMSIESVCYEFTR